jgi:hypothetical protein
MKKRSAPAPWTIDLFAHFARLGATGGAVLLADGSAPNALCTAYGILLQAQRRHRIKQDDGSAVYGVGRTPSGGRSIRLERPPKGRAFRAVDRSPRRLGCLGHVASSKRMRASSAAGLRANRFRESRSNIVWQSTISVMPFDDSFSCRLSSYRRLCSRREQPLTVQRRSIIATGSECCRS